MSCRGDLQLLCRACLSPAADMTSLFGSTSISHLLMTCCSVKISQDDGLPSQICKLCAKQAMTASSFKHMCEVSDAKLRNYLTGSFQLSSLLEIKEELSPLPSHELDSLLGDRPKTSTPELHSRLDDSDSKIPIYDCSLCNKTYLSTKELINHVLNTHGSLPKTNSLNKNSCEFCKTYFTSEYDLKQHQVYHKEFMVNGKYNTCPICHVEFQKHSLLLKHIETHLEISIFECKLCKCFFTTNLHLNKHIKTHAIPNEENHKEIDNSEFNESLVKTEPNDCSMDSDIKSEHKYNDTFDSILDFSDDELIADISNTELKSELTEDFTNGNLSDLNGDAGEFISKKRKSSKKKKKSKSPKDKMSKHGKNKTNHKLVLGENMKLKILPIFSEPKPIADEVVKKRIRSFLCSICGKGYFKQISLDKHIETHKKDTKKEDYVCKICGKIVHHSNHLQVHMRTHKDQNGEPMAPQEENPNKKMILCTMCGKSCSSRSNLAVHMRRHLGVMTCTCKICGKGYPRTTDLTLHMRRHTGERPFVCTHCNKSFARSDKLAIHMRIHTGERPYKCKICNRGFAQSNDLSSHKKRNNCSQTPPKPQAVDCDIPIHYPKVNSSEKATKNNRPTNSRPVSDSTDSVDDDQLLVSARTKALELAAVAVTNNILIMGNNTNTRVLEFLNSDPVTARNLVKQNLMLPELVATQRALEFANHHTNMLTPQQRSDFTDYATVTLLQNLSNAQNAQFDMR